MNIQLNYIEQGSGFPLILLHGNGEDHNYFKYQVDTFSRYFRVIAIDTRGHGKSPRGEAPFTIVQFAEDLHAFMEEHDIKQTHLLGFSDGGNIAIVFTLKYPQMVDKLILNGANLNSSGVKQVIQCPIEISYRIAKYFSQKNLNALKNTEILGLMVNEPNINITEIQKIKNKVLVIAGTNDMIKKSHTQLIYNNLQNAELEFIEGTHFIAYKNSEVFNHRVFEFLTEQI